MKLYVRLAWLTGATAVVLLVVFLCLRRAAQNKRLHRTIDYPGQLPAGPLPPETIFRRAFWREPSADDHIVHAERRDITDGKVTGPEGRLSNDVITGWQWFIAVRPSSSLLSRLRDPDTFSLMPVPAGKVVRPWPVTPKPAPVWFPSIDQVATGFEILQTHDTGLTVLYNARNNILFATDSGSGFAAPVR